MAKIKIAKFKGDLTPSALNELEKNSEIFLDCEATGLKYLNRDRLSLVSISTDNSDCFIVQPSKDYNSPNLVSLLTNNKIKIVKII